MLTIWGVLEVLDHMAEPHDRICPPSLPRCRSSTQKKLAGSSPGRPKSAPGDGGSIPEAVREGAKTSPGSSGRPSRAPPETLVRPRHVPRRLRGTSRSHFATCLVSFLGTCVASARGNLRTGAFNIYSYTMSGPPVACCWLPLPTIVSRTPPPVAFPALRRTPYIGS